MAPTATRPSVLALLAAALLLAPAASAQVVINEIHYDPAGSASTDTQGDANGDGVRSATQDEFVEIVNLGAASVDISGWTLSDAVSLRHTFPSGTILPASGAIVVFGGGTPTGTFGGSEVQVTNESSSLGLNNGGDTVTLNDGTNDVAVETYSGSVAGQSITRDPDGTGPFAAHSSATGSGGALFSPGTRTDGSSFGAAAPSPLVVTNTGDSGPGSLRAAIEAANATANADGPDVISFDIPGAGPHTIRPLSALPDITEAVVIDGLTEPGAGCDAWPATLQIELSGADAGPVEAGLLLDAGSDGSTIRGLVVNGFQGDGGFSEGHGLYAVDSGGHAFECNYVGTSVDGLSAVGNDGVGVFLFESAGNRVGGPDLSDRNLVSANGLGGVEVDVFATDVNALAAARTGPLVGDEDDDGDVADEGGRASTRAARAAGAARRVAALQNGTQIEGNYIGTDVTGNAPLGNDGNGVLIEDAVGVTVGGPQEGQRNVIGDNTDGVDVNDGVGTVIQNNYIGVGADGASAVGNSSDGVDLDGATGSTVVGNVVSGNESDGVDISVGASGNVVRGNLIGVAADGVAALGNRDGVRFGSRASDNTVGGTGPGDGNVIAYNGDLGVEAEDSTVRNAVLGNRVFANDDLGIDLEEDGVTPNDDADADDGANGLQNYPDLLTAVAGPGGTVVTGTLSSTPSTTFRVEFFSNAALDPSGFGEGETFLGAETVTTGPTGDAPIAATLAGAPAGAFVTATATAASGAAFDGTSEFSAGVAVTAAPLACSTLAPLSFDFNGDGAPSPRGNGDVTAADFDALTSDGDGEFAAVRNESASAPVDLAGCALVVFDPFDEDVTYADNITDPTVVPAGDSLVFDLPDMTLPDGPGAFALVTGTASPGQDVLLFAPTDGPSRVVAAVVYDENRTVYGSIQSPATPADLNQFLLAMAEAFGGATDAEGSAEADLDLTVWPNPSAGRARVAFGLAEAGDVRVSVYDALGREVAVLAEGSHGPGRHTAALDAGALAPGAYVVRVAGPAEARTARLTITR